MKKQSKKGMVRRMTIEKMTILSYILLVVAVMLGIVAVVLFFTLKIPKAYRSVKGQRKSKKKTKDNNKTKKQRVSLEMQMQSWKTETMRLKEGECQLQQTEQSPEDKVTFELLQDITYIHTEEV